MRETLDVRVLDDLAGEVLAPGEGSRTGVARALSMAFPSPRVEELRRIDRSFRKRHGHSLVTDWRIRRRYSSAEMAAAELLLVKLPFRVCVLNVRAFDEASACARCGAGVISKAPLSVDAGQLPKRADLVKLYTGELALSARGVEAARDAGLTGVTFRPMVSVSGRMTRWMQICVEPPFVEVGREAFFGDNALDSFPQAVPRCQCGRWAGRALISELFVERSSWEGRDFVATDQYVGLRQGEFRPAPLFCISARALRVFREAGLKGISVEVVRLV